MTGAARPPRLNRSPGADRLESSRSFLLRDCSLPVSPAPDSRQTPRDPLWWQLPLLLAVSAGYEALFVRHGLNLLDEGWPLYAAKRLHEGGVLYGDAFFVFPPGHVLSAWICYWWDPPGILATRTLYSAFNVALCAGLYLLGRRIMPPTFALVGGLLLAVAAPYSHMAHFLFGYRYLVLTVLVLLAFGQRLRRGDVRWMLVAGAFAGVSLCFRLTPAFAVSCAVAVGAVAAGRHWRRWLRDWSLYAAGLLLVVVPVALWFAASVGFETLWREVVVRPLIMTDLQSKPMPPIDMPVDWERKEISRTFTAIQFRAYLVLYAGYAVAVGFLWVRALVRRRPFEHVMLLTAVVWGGIYYLRTLGRSDIAHLESALPPICLLLAHLLWVTAAAVAPWIPGLPRLRRAYTIVLLAGVLASWVFLFRTDVFLRWENRGGYPLESLGASISLPSEERAARIDKVVMDVLRLSQPGDSILDLSRQPL